jgi:hypothetical protein
MRVSFQSPGWFFGQREAKMGTRVSSDNKLFDWPILKFNLMAPAFGQTYFSLNYAKTLSWNNGAWSCPTNMIQSIRRINA